VGIALLAALLAVMGMSTGWGASMVSAQDDAVTPAAIIPGTNAVVANGPLNQRSTASTSGSILQVLSTGAIVAVISGPTYANGYSWFNVTANAINGYVAGEFLAEVGFVIGDSVFINSNNVNIRSGPGTGNPVITQLDYGALGEVIGGPTSANGYVWYQIQYGTSSTGWVAGLYLSLSSTPSGEFGVGSWIFVDDPPVNLRSGPGTGFSVIGSLANNIGVQVTGTPTSANGFTWYPVTTLNAVNGYAAGEYFTGGIYLNDYGMVTDGPLNLRSTASTSGTILATMPNNASVFVNSVTPVTANGYTWLNVTYNGITGWAVGGYMGPL
jgi:uncharacterized protein YgiM (DUF1202 family)